MRGGSSGRRLHGSCWRRALRMFDRPSFPNVDVEHHGTEVLVAVVKNDVCDVAEHRRVSREPLVNGLTGIVGSDRPRMHQLRIHMQDGERNRGSDQLAQHGHVGAHGEITTGGDGCLIAFMQVRVTRLITSMLLRQAKTNATESNRKSQAGTFDLSLMLVCMTHSHMFRFPDSVRHS